MPSPTPPRGSGSVVFLPGSSSPPAPRTRTVIAAEMQAHSDAVKVHTDAIQALALEWLTACDGEAASPPARREETLSLKRAAHLVGWTEQRLLRRIVRHNAAYPHDRLAHQPGGMKNSPWEVRVERLRRYIRDMPTEG